MTQPISYAQASGAHTLDKEMGKEMIVCTVANAGVEECAPDEGILAPSGKASGSRQDLNWGCVIKELAREAPERERASYQSSIWSQSYVIRTESAFCLPRLPSGHVTERQVSCSLNSQYLRGWLVGKESLPYFGGWQLWGRGWAHVQRHNQWARTCKGEFQGVCRQRQEAACKNNTVSSDSHLEIGHVVIWKASSWLFWAQLIFSSRISLFPFLRGQYSELWQLMSWLRSGHHVSNFFHLMWFSVSVRQLTGYGSEYYL